MAEIRTTHSAEETAALAAAFARTLVAGDIVALEGDLGAGKTTFVQGIAAGLGVRDVVNSPTFKIASEYEGSLPLVHIDFYRLRSVEDLARIGWEDFLDGSRVVVIEWANLFPQAIPDGVIRIVFRRTQGREEARAIKIEREALRAAGD